MIVYPEGLWDKEEVLTLNVVDDNFAANSVVLQPERSYPGPTAPLAAKLGLQRVDFVKMDIEGAESRAVAGARNTLKGYSHAFPSQQNTVRMMSWPLRKRCTRFDPATGWRVGTAWKRMGASEPASCASTDDCKACA